MFATYLIAALIAAVGAWIVYAAVTERTGRIRSDFREAARLLNGKLTEDPAEGAKTTPVLTCAHLDHEFRISVEANRGADGDGHTFSVTVPVPACRREFMVAPRSLRPWLDRWTKKRLFADAIEVQLGAGGALVGGDGRHSFAKQIRSDSRLVGAVRFLVLDSGQKGFAVSDGVLRASKPFQAWDTRPDRLRTLLSHLSMIADSLEQPS